MSLTELTLLLVVVLAAAFGGYVLYRRAAEAAHQRALDAEPKHFVMDEGVPLDADTVARLERAKLDALQRDVQALEFANTAGTHYLSGTT